MSTYMLFLTKSLMFNFISKDSGVRCWGENLLNQRGRETTQLLCPPFPPLSQKLNFFSYAVPNKTPPTRCSSILLPVCLFLPPPDFQLLSIVFSCQVVGSFAF